MMALRGSRSVLEPVASTAACSLSRSAIARCQSSHAPAREQPASSLTGVTEPRGSNFLVMKSSGVRESIRFRCRRELLVLMGPTGEPRSASRAARGLYTRSRNCAARKVQNVARLDSVTGGLRALKSSPRSRFEGPKHHRRRTLRACVIDGGAQGLGINDEAAVSLRLQASTMPSRRRDLLPRRSANVVK